MGTIQTTDRHGQSKKKRITARTKFFRSINDELAALDLSALGVAPALIEVTVHGSPPMAVDLAPLAGQPALNSLTLPVAPSVDLAPLLACPSLEHLTLQVGGDGRLALDALAAHPALHTLGLTFKDQPTLDLSFARELPALRSLSIEGGEWQELDLSPLAGCRLQSITISSQYITEVDLSHVAGPDLEVLFLQDLECASLDLAPLRTCERLNHLSIQSFPKLGQGAPDRRWLDLSPLASCRSLSWFSLAGNELDYLDLSPLAKLPNLTHFTRPRGYRDLVMGEDAMPIVAPALRALQRELTIE